MGKGRVWTQEEQKLLVENWPSLGMKCAHLFPNHSAQAVKVRSYFLGLRYQGSRTYPCEWKHKKSGSGNITPPTYRAQLCRERLMVGPQVESSTRYTYGRRIV